MGQMGDEAKCGGIFFSGVDDFDSLVCFSENWFEETGRWANNKNVPVVNFHKMYAAVTHVDETHTFFTFDDANFLKALRIFKKFHSINF